MRTFRTAIVIPLLALFVLVSTGTVYAQEYASRLPNVNDASDRKAIIAVVRAAKAVGSDLNGLRLVISSDCQCGGAYAGKGLFIADENFLNLPQWTLDAVMAHEEELLAIRAERPWIKPRQRSSGCRRGQGRIPL